MQLSFAEMFYEQKLDVRDNDVTSHVTILNVSISLVYCLFRRPRVPNYSNMSHETQGSVLVDDVTGHVTILKVLYFACILLIRKQKVPNYYNMSYETQRCSFFDDVTSHVTRLRAPNYYNMSYDGQGEITEGEIPGTPDSQVVEALADPIIFRITETKK